MQIIYKKNPLHYFFFFFNDTATTEIYTLSLHDALPILRLASDSRTTSLQGPLFAEDSDLSSSATIPGPPSRSPVRHLSPPMRRMLFRLPISPACHCLLKVPTQILLGP